jgi:hypothetical protein
MDVTYILQWLYMCFSSVSDVCCKCFSCFGRMLQVFHLDVARVVMGPTCHCACAWEAEGMAAGARPIPVCACSRAQAVPSITGGTR